MAAKVRPGRRQRSRRPGILERSLRRVTAHGLDLRLDCYRDIDDGMSDGWTVDLVEAHTDTGPAGYLKVAFIPSERMQAVYPDALAYEVRKRGRWHSLHELLASEAAWGREQLLAALHAADDWQAGRHDDRRAGMTDSDLAEEWARARRRMVAAGQAGYEKFCAYHQDRPVVDYSQVYDGRRDSPFIGSLRDEHAPVPSDMRLQGVGTVLYETAALWMHSRGLILHASSLQSDSAKLVWDALDRRGLVMALPGDRRGLNANALLHARPQLAWD